jgi:hypothetical protein
MHASLTQPNLDMEFLPLPLPTFGAWVRHRRIRLGLNIARASASCGIKMNLWRLLEEGWVPVRNENFMRALSATLEIGFDDLACATAPSEAHFTDTQD